MLLIKWFKLCIYKKGKYLFEQINLLCQTKTRQIWILIFKEVFCMSSLYEKIFRFKKG